MEENTRVVTERLNGGNYVNASGHSLGIFALKFVSSDKNILFSTGLDQTIQQWDRRVGHAVASMGREAEKPSSGTALEVADDGSQVVAPVEGGGVAIWDVRQRVVRETVDCFVKRNKRQEKEEIDQEGINQKKKQRPPQQFRLPVFSLSQFPDRTTLAIAGGTAGGGAAVVLDRNRGWEEVGGIRCLSHPVYSVDAAAGGEMVAIGGADGSIRVMVVVVKETTMEEEDQEERR
eukprot:GHVS01026645.1.p1 GENE.GHVS01026645.1~~GHVS01026645.1.p1  ORF type:complete len:233 (-),score=62.74 GHVS01026645.1:328-1026(-)